MSTFDGRDKDICRAERHSEEEVGVNRVCTGKSTCENMECVVLYLCKAATTINVNLFLI